MKYKIK